MYLCFLPKKKKKLRPCVLISLFSLSRISHQCIIGHHRRISQDNVQIYYSSRLSVIINSFPRGATFADVFLISPSRNAELCHIQLYTVSQPQLHVVSFALLHTRVYLCRPFDIHTLFKSMFSQRHWGNVLRQQNDEIIMVSDSHVLQGWIFKNIKYTFPCKIYT